MSLDQNKALVRRYFAAIDADRMEEMAGCFADDLTLRFDGNPAMDKVSGVGFIGSFASALRPLQHEVIDQIAEGDKVTTRIRVRGVHTADLFGIPATGNAIDITSINIHRISNGKIVEAWVNADSLGMMQQLGVIPKMG